MTLLKVEQLDVWFELEGGGSVHAVRDLSIGLDAGDALGLVGESGSGKTTAMLALAGLLPGNATVRGRIALDGEDLLAGGEEAFRRHRWRDIAIVFQGAMNALNPVKRVGSQLVEPMELHGVASGSEARNRAAKLLDDVELGASEIDRYPHELSGGMRQRACLAMALACEPKVLLADEPTTALDVLTQAEILALLQSLAEKRGLSLIMVTHDLPVVAQVCHRVAVMYGGGLMEEGSTYDLLDLAAHPYTQMLFAATPDIYDATPVELMPAAQDLATGDNGGCPFRARCPHAFERCADERPAAHNVGNQHRSACHLAE